MSSSVYPIIESLIFGDKKVNIESINRQIDIRKKLRQSFDEIGRPNFDHFEFYDLLNRFLESGDNDRFILYCPAYLIPHAESYRKHNKFIDTFSELFINSWLRLLNVYDIRTNFTNGDIQNISDECLRVQAAYLAPMLISKKLISLNKLDISDDILKISFDEAINGNVHIINECVDEKRLQWLKWEEHRLYIKKRGLELGLSIINNMIPNNIDVDDEIYASGIMSAIEQCAINSHKVNAVDIFHKFENDLYRLNELHDLSARLCRIYHLGVINRDQLDQFGVFVPHLDGPFFKNLDNISEVRDDIKTIIIENNLTYPAVMINGSKLKGYGRKDSDIDISIFAKVGENINNALNSFNLNIKNCNIKIYYLNDDYSINGENDVQIGQLLCGSWEGDYSTIELLSSKFINHCFKNQDDRDIYLREIERCVLQYRLLHRGYEEYYLTDGPTFLDDGYRTVASKLFISHVFLPQINGDVNEEILLC